MPVGSESSRFNIVNYYMNCYMDWPNFNAAAADAILASSTRTL
jgi:hypothetical protein